MPARKREEIRQYFHATYSLDEQLYETLASEAAFYLRPEPLRHPLIFYLGHTATFYINKLIVAKITNQRINPRFESMFAVGVDEMSWDDLNAANYDWPTLAEVKAYRDTVRAVVDETIRTMPLTMPIDWDHPFWVILMGIEHERIHIETSSVTSGACRSRWCDRSRCGVSARWRARRRRTNWCRSPEAASCWASPRTPAVRLG